MKKKMGKVKKTASELNKAFFAINDTIMEKIDLSEFDFPGEIFAKTVSFEDWQSLQKRCTVLREDHDPDNLKAEDYILSDDFVGCTVALSVCDSEGNLIFSEEEVPAIQKKSMPLFQKVSSAVSKLNKVIAEEEVEKEEKK